MIVKEMQSFCGLIILGRLIITHSVNYKYQTPKRDSMNNCDQLFKTEDNEDIKPLFIEVDTDRTITTSELKVSVKNFAAELQNRGICSGDKVTLHLFNNIDFIIVSMAIEYLGAVTCFVDPLTQPKSLPYYLRDTESKLLITYKKANALPEEVVDLVDILEEDYISSYTDREPCTIGKPFKWNSETVSAIYYTSGTTSEPKGVMLTPASQESAHKIIDTYWAPVNSDSRHLGFVPFSHGFGSVHVIPQVIRTNGQLYIMRSFHPGKVAEAIDKYDITHIYGVPSHYQQLLRFPTFHPALKKLEMAFCAAAKLEYETMIEWKEVTGFYLTEGYGLIETSTGVAFRINQKPLQTGHLGVCPDPELVEIAIMDENHNLLPDGEEGEIVIRGKSTMKGYLNKPKENEAVFYKEWFKTGDKGFISPEKALFMTGRIKDIINVAGIKISPYEVEAVLNVHEDVEQSIVTSVEDALYGEVVKAFIKRKDGVSVTERQLVRYASEQLMSFQVPKQISFVEDFPLNNMGKIDRKALRKC